MKIGNHTWPIKWHQYQWTLSGLESYLNSLKLSDSHTSGNTACINCKSGNISEMVQDARFTTDH